MAKLERVMFLKLDCGFVFEEILVLQDIILSPCAFV